MKNIIIAALSLIVVVQLVFIIRKPKPQIVQVKGDPYEVQVPVIDTQYIPEIQYVEVKGKDIVHDSIVYVPTAVSADTLARCLHLG